MCEVSDDLLPVFAHSINSDECITLKLDDFPELGGIAALLRFKVE